MLYWAIPDQVEEPDGLGSIPDLREERLADLLDFLETAARVGNVQPVVVDKAKRIDDFGHSLLINLIGRGSTDQSLLALFRFLEDLQAAVAEFELPLSDPDHRVAFGQARLESIPFRLATGEFLKNRAGQHKRGHCRLEFTDAAC